MVNPRFVTKDIMCPYFFCNPQFVFAGSVLDALFSTYQIETMDGWEMIYRQQMFGCANWESQTSPMPKGPKEDKYACNPDPEGLGFAAAFYFIFVVVFGGLILPTMLIGIVAIAIVFMGFATFRVLLG